MSVDVRELTPTGAGGVSVLLVRGSEARERIAALGGGRAPSVGRAMLLELADTEGPLDEALAIALDEQRYELHLHGSRPMVERVAAALGASLTSSLAGAPGAEGVAAPLEARAWAALTQAPSEDAARVLLDQAEGALRRAFEALLVCDGDERVRGARELADRGRRLAPLFSPARVVLAGPVNAGKSTLFNVLVGHGRVIVSDEPGTTRDRIVERARLGAYAVDLCDTAGTRELVGEDGRTELERRGQALAAAERRAADLVLWLAPAEGRGGPEPVLAGERRRVLTSRADLVATHAEPGVRAISALHDPEGARRVVEAAFLDALVLPAEPWQAGCAVPFEPELCDALARAAVEGPAAVARKVRELLEPAAGQDGEGGAGGPSKRGR